MFFKTETVTDRITRISGIAGELMYLAEGDREAALIDTGVGVGNLKELVHSLTKKEVFVLLSHGHVDHALGARVFERVYMSPLDEKVYEENAKMLHRKNFLDASVPGWRDKVNPEDFVEKPVNCFLPLADGQRFELGGLTIEAVSLSGHTPGSMAFLFEEERALLFGDACNSYTYLFDHNSCFVSEYRENLLQFRKKVKGRYDSGYVSHGTGNAAEGLLESAVSLTADILKGNVDDIPFAFMGETAYIAKKVNENLKRLDGGSANIIYSKDKVRRKGGCKGL